MRNGEPFPPGVYEVFAPYMGAAGPSGGFVSRAALSAFHETMRVLGIIAARHEVPQPITEAEVIAERDRQRIALRDRDNQQAPARGAAVNADSSGGGGSGGSLPQAMVRGAAVNTERDSQQAASDLGGKMAGKAPAKRETKKTAKAKGKSMAASAGAAQSGRTAAPPAAK